MVVALLVLSLAMMAGGLFAMILGWDIVLLERGWAMVIAGSVSASGGAILLGLVAVLGRLGRMESDLEILRERARGAELPLPPSPVVDPVALAASGLLVGGATEKERSDERADAEPLPHSSVEPQDRSGGEPPAPAAHGTADEGRRPEGPPAGIGRQGRFPAPPPVGPPEPRSAAPEDLFENGLPRRGGASAGETPESAGPEWARGTPESEPPKPDWATDKADEAPPSPAGRPTVIGTYNSGGNRYVMFSDGSIEAETPDGTFRFGSLDELKEFIASGGEAGSPT
jgi:hypothetical protein